VKPPVDRPESRARLPVTVRSNTSRAFSNFNPALQTNLGTSALTRILASSGTGDPAFRVCLPLTNTLPILR